MGSIEAPASSDAKPAWRNNCDLSPVTGPSASVDFSPPRQPSSAANHHVWYHRSVRRLKQETEEISSDSNDTQPSIDSFAATYPQVLPNSLGANCVFMFVYGTLKKGYTNHYNLLTDGISYFQDGVTSNPYVMYLDPFNRSRPCLADASSCVNLAELMRDVASDLKRSWGFPIRGELYRVEASMLEALDKFERVPLHYIRQTISVQGLVDHLDYPAEVYFNKTSSQRWSELLGGRFPLLQNYSMADHKLYEPRLSREKPLNARCRPRQTNS